MSKHLLSGKVADPHSGKTNTRTKKTKRSKTGRPTELTEEIIRGVEKALRIGTPPMTAFAFMDVGYATLREWVAKGNEDETSVYGRMLRSVSRAIAEWEVKDISIIERHAMGAPAEYEMEVAYDENGKPLKDEQNRVIMQVARRPDGSPIVRRHEIKSDWRAAMERLARRRASSWAHKGAIDIEAVLTFDNSKPEEKEAMTFNERIAIAVKKLEEDV